MRTTELDQALGVLQHKADEIYQRMRPHLRSHALEFRFRDWYEAMNQLRVDVLSNPWEKKMREAEIAAHVRFPDHVEHIHLSTGYDQAVESIKRIRSTNRTGD